MAKEIERKFLVDPVLWKPPGEKIAIKQAYLQVDPERTVRVRIAGNSAEITIKGITKGITRDEFNFPITVADAHGLFKLAVNTPIEKNRYRVIYQGKLWEVDEFLGENKGLLLAEVELDSENEKISLPEWVLTEVSENVKYYNSYLSENPYSHWEK